MFLVLTINDNGMSLLVLSLLQKYLGDLAYDCYACMCAQLFKVHLQNS